MKFDVDGRWIEVVLKQMVKIGFEYVWGVVVEVKVIVFQ